MVGYNDTIQVPHRFGSAEQRLWSFGPLGLQLWDSIRALDFLASLDDVDAGQLGITGASGGGTQTFLLTAVDDRVQFASPVNMVSAIMQGGDLCENAPGLRLNTSNVEIAAMFAPKPMLLVSATGDWTHNVPKEEYPAIKRIYDLYGKGDQVEVVQIDEKHNYNRLSREAVYRFFAKQHPGLSDSRELTEREMEVPMIQEMAVLANRTLPANALDLDGVFRAVAEDCAGPEQPDAGSHVSAGSFEADACGGNAVRCDRRCSGPVDRAQPRVEARSRAGYLDSRKEQGGKGRGCGEPEWFGGGTGIRCW